MNIKLITGLAIICLIAIFIIQNIAVVEVHIFFWTLEMSLVLLILVLFGIGLALGWLLKDYLTHRKKKV
jgi:uncharacterized integral membrane protein